MRLYNDDELLMLRVSYNVDLQRDVYNVSGRSGENSRNQAALPHSGHQKHEEVLQFRSPGNFVTQPAFEVLCLV